MKRIFSTLIIAVILTANLFAPFEYSIKEKSFKKSQVQAESTLISGKDITQCSTKNTRDADYCIYTNGGRVVSIENGTMTLRIGIVMESNIDTDDYIAITAVLREKGVPEPVKVWTNYRNTEFNYSVVSSNAARGDKNGLTLKYNEYQKTGEDDFDDWATITGVLEALNLKPNTDYVLEFSVAPVDDGLIGSGGAMEIFSKKLDTDQVFKKFPVSYTNSSGSPINSDLINTYSLDITTGAIGTKTTIDGQVIGTGGEITTMPECGVTSGVAIFGCVAQIVYYVGYVPTSWGMAAAGMFMDFSLDYSLDSASYSGESTGFVTKAWGFIRDLCNIFFIVSMLYIALGVIFEFKGAGDWKKSVGSLVIAALAINFSLFITKIPIDLGNISARVFYNSDLIKITKVTDTGQTTGTLSEAVVEGFNPQRILYEGLTKINNVGGEKQPASGVTPGTFLIVTIFAIIINWIALWIFFKIGLLFLGRVVSLWYHMILSPLAFVSDYLPNAIKSSVGSFNFSSWMQEIVRLSVMPVIFMALMYLLLLFINLGAPAITKDGNAFAWIIGTVAPFVFVIIMLKKAQTTTEGFADSTAKTVADYAGKTIGTVAGLAAGGAGFAGRRIIGSRLANLANSSSLKDAASKGGVGGAMARMTLKGADYGSKASFDLRGTGALKKAGFDDSYSKGAAAKMFGMDLKDGGYVGAEKRRKEMHDKRMKQFAANDDEYKALKAKEEKRLGDQFNKDEFEKKYGKNADELNIKRQTAYAENIKNRKGISGAINKTTGFIAGNNIADEKFADKVLKDNKKKQKDIDSKKKKISDIDTQMEIISDNLTAIDEYFEKLSTNADFAAIKNKIEQDENAAKAADPSYEKKSPEKIEALARNKYEQELKDEKERLENEYAQWQKTGSGNFTKMSELNDVKKKHTEIISNKETKKKLDSDYDKLEARKNKLSPKEDKKEDKKDDEKK